MKKGFELWRHMMAVFCGIALFLSEIGSVNAIAITGLIIEEDGVFACEEEASYE